MSKAEVKAHLVWRVLARDQALLNDYTDFIFAEFKERFGYEAGMGVFPGSCGGDKPEMMAWSVWSFKERSLASGRCDLEGRDGHLVGFLKKLNYPKEKMDIAPEVLGAPGKMTSVETARKQLGQIDKLLNFAVDKVKSLLGKL
jgi:hypothetical protein